MTKLTELYLKRESDRSSRTFQYSPVEDGRSKLVAAETKDYGGRDESVRYAPVEFIAADSFTPGTEGARIVGYILEWETNE